LKEGISAARRHLIRDAIIYTPLLLLAIFAWGATLGGVVAAGGGGGIFLLFLLAIVVFLAGFQSIQSLRDLRSVPVTTEGPVVRKWRRAEFLLFPAHYFYVNRNVFRVPALLYREIQEGDTVAIIHYPHTATVAEVRRVRRRDAPPGT
jgi:hypothetical protein